MTPSIRAELASAIREVNAAYQRLGERARTRVTIVSDDVLNAALLDGDRDQALAAISDWRDRQLAVIEEAVR